MLSWLTNKGLSLKSEVRRWGNIFVGPRADATLLCTHRIRELRREKNRRKVWRALQNKAEDTVTEIDVYALLHI